MIKAFIRFLQGGLWTMVHSDPVLNAARYLAADVSFYKIFLKESFLINRHQHFAIVFFATFPFSFENYYYKI